MDKIKCRTETMVTLLRQMREILVEMKTPMGIVKEGRGRGALPPAQLKQVQFVLNRKHALFDAMS